MISQLTFGFCAFSGIFPTPWTKPQQKTTPTSKPAVKVVTPTVTTPTSKPEASTPFTEITELGYEGCDIVFLPKGVPQVLFVCGRRIDETLSPSLFYYDTSAPTTNKSRHILGVTYKSSSSVTITFKKDPKSIPLKYPPYWFNKWKGMGTVSPDTNCSLEPTGSTYTLKCKDKTGKGVEVQKGINL
ncbi:hypothetical protein OVS_03435 [Mycoplasma ovis str. Michigan]|uniref:Uncharacterized protein n=1 Tax=Mycoplasma ovis str. Michigan TaxID=1415773 RepID=A0ABM5P1T6_9MOLU|nr:hypothetical protein [Mycoplasma ovis]AHC40437.1 hypothetical protein OVS_03435 [Mycoplasma ovis str. Michigan]